MPRAQMSWKPPRRSRHWSNSATLKTRARIEVRAGSRTVIGVASVLRLEDGDESHEQAVEQRRRVLVERAEMGRVEGPASAQAGELGEERLARRNEQRHGLGQAGTGRGETAREVVNDRRRLGLDRRALVRGRVEIADEDPHEASAVTPVGIALAVVAGGGVPDRQTGLVL